MAVNRLTNIIYFIVLSHSCPGDLIVFLKVKHNNVMVYAGLFISELRIVLTGS